MSIKSTILNKSYFFLKEILKMKENEQMEFLLHNIFLPHRLPLAAEKTELSGALVQFTFNSLPSSETPILALKSVRNTMQTWVNVQKGCVNENCVWEALQALQPGQTFAIFVRAQNSVMTIRRSNCEINDALMSVSRASATNEKVLTAGDLLITLPERAVWIPFCRFLSKTFACQVAALCNNMFEETMKETLKAGISHPDSRDVAEPFFVMSWLLAAMSGTIQVADEFICVQKVIRDDVLSNKDSESPWRRSGEWIAIKSVLHIILATELGSDEGTIVYKSLMIHIMLYFLDNHPNSFDDNDILMQMLSKVSRQMLKLRNRINNSNKVSVGNHTIQWASNIFQKSCNTLQKIRKVADNRWKDYANACSESVQINVSRLHARHHSVHKMSETALCRLKQAFQEVEDPSFQVPIPSCVKRSNKETTLFDINFLESAVRENQIEENVWDFEMWVRNVLWEGFTLNVSQFLTRIGEIFNLFQKYLDISVTFYKDDALGSSRMVLTIFLTLAALDKIALTEWSIMSEYHSSFDECVFDGLLVPLFDDLKYLHAVQMYFKYRNKSAIYPSIISELSENSIGPRIAAENQEMQLKREEILLYAEQQRQLKAEELEREKECYDDLMSAYYVKSHCYFCDNWFQRCSKCELLRQASSIKVGVYEDPIPKDCIWKQNMIVFELSIPTSIRCIRDALFLVHHKLCENQFLKTKIKQSWKLHPQLLKWVSSECNISILSIGSTAVLFSKTLFSEVNVNSTSSIDSFLKPCGLTIKLVYQIAHKKHLNVECNNVKTVQNMFHTMTAWNQPYDINPKWISGTTHTENEVLAFQEKCPLNLDINEFKVFGSLRAGHRLQLRNLLRALEMRTLSFERSSVFALVAQALWQVGPADQSTIYDSVLSLESHIDLRNDGFCSALIECLSEFLESISKNWKKHNQLQIGIIIALRMFSLSSEPIRLKANFVLIRCREIAEKWANEIEKLLSLMNVTTTGDVEQVRFKLVDVAAFAALTFDVDECNGHLVFNKDTLVSWLHAVSRIHDNILLNKCSFDIERVNLLRRVRLTGLRFENILSKTLASNSTEIFGKFLFLIWSDFCKGKCRNIWTPYLQPARQWYHNIFEVSAYRSLTLQINILSGKFLVHGNPVGRLPESITAAPDYARVFGSCIFEVQPAAERSNTFVTMHKLQGSTFTFSLRNHGLVVVERRQEGDEYELIPNNVFNEDYPDLFLSNYSHWLCKQTTVLYFRPVKFNDCNFFNFNEHFPYQFNLQQRTLFDLQRKRYLIDIRSDTFNEVFYCGGMRRLEFKKYMHLWLHIKEDILHEDTQLKDNAQLKVEQFTLSVELPRMDLCFIVDEKTGKLFSREHAGLVVANHQGNFGTLIGLRNGILLCEDDPLVHADYLGHTVLLLPYVEKIELGESKNACGQSVTINFDELLSPPCFAYYLDDRLCELRGPASQEAWLYLALLHAMTSSSLPDPFTGLTGSESSMRLLQIGRTFSCRPLTKNAFHTLKCISKLAPNRTFYPTHLNHTQTVTWLSNLRSTYGYEGLVLASKILLNNADRYQELFTSNIQEDLKDENINGVSMFLVKRAYWRHRRQLNPCARLNVDSEQKFGGSPLRLRAWTYKDDENKIEVKMSRLLTETYYQWKGIRLDPSTNLWHIIQNEKQLKQPEKVTFFSVLTWREITLPDSYLQLYELAQSVHEEKFCRFQFSLLLSFLAFKGTNINLLFSLLAVAIMGVNIKPPTVRDYDFLKETDFDMNKIYSVIENETKTIKLYSSQLSFNYSEEKIKEMYDSSRKRARDILGDIAKNQWVLKRVNFNSSCSDIVYVSSLEEKINILFTRWTNNDTLKSFFTDIEMKIREWQPSPQLPVTTLSYLDISVSSFKINKNFHGDLSQTSLKENDLIFPIRNLPDNQEAVLLYRKQSNVNYKKVHDDVNDDDDDLKKEIDFQTISSLFQDLTINSDAVHQYMRSAMETSSDFFRKNKELALKKESKNEDVVEECRNCLNTNALKSRIWWGEVLAAMKPQSDDVVGNALVAGGLWRRFSRVSIILCVLPLTSFSCMLLAIDDKDAIPQSVVDRLGAVIVCWTAEQRAIRCLKLARNKSAPALLSCEMNNSGHENWIPSENPEWLILELEGNFLIRPVQVNVAQSMLNATENFVQQLNMGEGKTSVIVPLLAVSLSNLDQFVRITVLRCLMLTNLEALVDILGGLLNRRVYTVPCRRDMKLNALKFLSIHQECLTGRGIMLTTPEYRLSLELKTLEHCRNGDADAIQLYELRCWLRKHARDILDEADEILNVKYQVVYTLGDQLLVDGGESRWIIAQAVLKLVNKFATELLQQYGKDCIEYKTDEKRGSDAFSNIRFLSNNIDMYKTLCRLIVDSILEKEVPEVSVAANLGQQDKNYVRSYILSNDLNQENELIDRLNELFIENPMLKEELLILRGIFCFEVLHMALQKRWRVNFGINPVSTSSQMAVPFRAKDVAAERTEFGHPDVAIILTQISYYMSGLNEAQMNDVFKHLDNCSYKNEEYERWIEAIGVHKVSKDLRTLNGVNLDDIKQREQLYSLLCYSMNVVNFWLSRTVFPRESKQFAHKISMSAWDLSLSIDQLGSGSEKPTTGFSGTNESQLLLPLTIKQKDLPQIIGTNAMVISYLLQSENNSYYHFDPCAETLEENVLNKAVETGARVLLDVGALMLQMDNEKVAQEWLWKLSATKQVSAAVFFGNDDRLTVCDREGRRCPFTVSPYYNQLDRCVFYLDDIHTRGTDLRFPFNSLACVTLGKGLTKDRLVQACMRMRLLGKGHSVYFCAANDVHMSIKKQMKSNDRGPQAADILRWAIENSCDSVRDGLLNWASQGLVRSLKEAAESSINHKSVNMYKTTSDDLKNLGMRCTEDEVTQLFQFYGGSRSWEFVPLIIKKSLSNNVKRAKEFFVGDHDSAKNFNKVIISIGENIVSRCNEYVSTYKRFANILDEEQERELEVELEEERQVHRPGPQNPHKPTVSQEIKFLAKTGFLKNVSDLVDILTVNKIFDNTNRLSKLFLRDGWNPGLLVTKEFITVIEGSNIEEGDNFLSEIFWVVIIAPTPHLNRTSYILISSFEANELFPIFLSAEQNRGVGLHMFTPRLRRGQNILINQSALSIPDSISPVVDNLLICQLSVLSGGLFFDTEQDEDAYCEFLKILLNSSNSEAKNDDFQRTVFQSHKHLNLKTPREVVIIQKTPAEMAIEILRTRGRTVHTTSSHVCLLLFHDSRTYKYDFVFLFC